MINNERFENIFTEDTPMNMQLLVRVSNGSYLTNTEISQESFNLIESISDSNELKFGGCNSNSFKMRIRNTVRDLTNKKIIVDLFAFEDADIRIEIVNSEPKKRNIITNELSNLGEDYFRIGEYTVKTDRPTADSMYRDITAYDALEAAISGNVLQWYISVFQARDKVTLKELREGLLTHLGIAYEPFNGVNDSMEVGKNLPVTNGISGKTILANICELNGCFGFITRDNKFRCKTLSHNIVKTYERYLQGQVSYQDAVSNVITRLDITNDITNVTVDTGDQGSAYIINSNPLLNGLSETNLQTIARGLLPIIAGTDYRPFSCKTYGDPCIELGDYIEIPTTDETIYSFVLSRTLTGTQALRDALEAKGEEYNSQKVVGNDAVINQIYSAINNASVGSGVDILYYTNNEAIQFSDTWQEIANLRLVSPTTQMSQCFGVIRFTLDEPGIIYLRYLVNGDALPLTSVFQMPRDISTLTLFMPVPIQENVLTNVTLEILTDGATGSVSINDLQFTLQANNLIKAEEWDGLITVSDNFALTLHDNRSLSFSDDEPVITQMPPMRVNAPYDHFSLDVHGGLGLAFSDENVIVTTFTDEYDRTDSNGEFRTDSDGLRRRTRGGIT